MFRRIATLTLSLAIAASVSAVPVSAANDFADVPVTHKYYESVAFCRDKQIVAGVGNNFFCAGCTVDRVSILYDVMPGIFSG